MNIQEINKSISLLLKVSILLGTISFLAYCSTLNFYPQNIQLGDGLLLGFIFVVFGVLITLSITFFSVSSLALVNTLVLLYRLPSFIIKSLSVVKKEKQLRWMVLSGMMNKFIKDHSINSIYLLGIIGLSCLIPFLYHYIEINQLHYLAITIIIACLFYVGISCKIYAGFKEKTNVTTFVMFVILISPYFVINDVFKNTLISAAESLGVRNSSVSVYVEKDYLPIVEDIVKKNDLTNYPIVSVDANYSRLDHVDVLFTGVGNSSLFSIEDSQHQAHFILPANAFYIEKSLLHDNVNRLITAIKSSCTTVFKTNKIQFDSYQMVINFHRSYGYFKVGESDVSAKYQRVLISTLEPLLAVLQQHDELIKSVEIIGISSEEWKGSKGDLEAYKYNYDLSVKRALAVSNVLFESPELQKYGAWISQKLVVRGELSEKDSENRKVMIKINLNH